MEQFKGGLRVGGMVERLVYAHFQQLEVLADAAMNVLKTNVHSFQVYD